MRNDTNLVFSSQDDRVNANIAYTNLVNCNQERGNEMRSEETSGKCDYNADYKDLKDKFDYLESENKILNNQLNYLEGFKNAVETIFRGNE